MTIKEKLDDIKDKGYFIFCGMNLEMQDYDLVRIYDKVDGSCVFNIEYMKSVEIPEELLNKEFKQIDIRKLDRGISPWALCFYLDKPEKIEPGISARVKYNG